MKKSSSPNYNLDAFNSALESSVRTIILLEKTFPEEMDLESLITFDYFLVHTGDIEGPPSLHPDAPGRGKELVVRRAIVERGIVLLLSKKLIDRKATLEGFVYQANDYSPAFIKTLKSNYIADLSNRADWLIRNLGHLTKDQINSQFKKIVDYEVFETYPSTGFLEENK